MSRRKRQGRSLERRVVRERVCDDVEPCGTQSGEKCVGIADAGNGVQRHVPKRIQGPMLTGNEIDGIAEAQLRGGDERPAGFDAASRRAAPFGHDDGIDTLESPRWLAQRARGQQLAVAEPPRGIDHGDLEITRQPQMLQAVVADDDLGARLGRTPRGRDAICTDHDHARPAQRVQHGLVADFGRVAGGRDDRGRPTTRPP